MEEISLTRETYKTKDVKGWDLCDVPSNHPVFVCVCVCVWSFYPSTRVSALISIGCPGLSVIDHSTCHRETCHALELICRLTAGHRSWGPKERQWLWDWKSFLVFFIFWPFWSLLQLLEGTEYRAV